MGNDTSELVFYDEIMGTSILLDKNLLEYLEQYRRYVNCIAVSTHIHKDFLHSYGFIYEQNMEKE